MSERKIRRPSKIPATCTITFDLLGDEQERLSQYMWFKAIEKTVLPALAQALFQCETCGRPVDEIIEWFDGLLEDDDLPALLSRSA